MYWHIEKNRYNKSMNEIDIFKALANETRLNILKWLKDPGKYFPPQGIHIPEGRVLKIVSA